MLPVLFKQLQLAAPAAPALLQLQQKWQPQHQQQPSHTESLSCSQQFTTHNTSTSSLLSLLLFLFRGPHTPLLSLITYHAAVIDTSLQLCQIWLDSSQSLHRHHHTHAHAQQPESVYPITSVLWVFFFIHYALLVTISAAANRTALTAQLGLQSSRRRRRLASSTPVALLQQ